MKRNFTAWEYRADGNFAKAEFSFSGSPCSGWTIARNGEPHLKLGRGYRLLRTESCGICSTDLARRFLPFPLPQVTGHEVFARGEDGTRYAVEINASHRARGVRNCRLCAAGLDRHCPNRLVLGINALPGGFGPYLLAPVNAAVPVPEAIGDEAIPFIEPLAAAINAVDAVAPAAGERIAVLGPRKLGLLVIAALAARRKESGRAFSVSALGRRGGPLELARELGAGETILLRDGGKELEERSFDAVIDTSGTPEGLEIAIRLARRELHLKSTHGRPAAGLEHLTELVVDELSIARCPPELASAGGGMSRAGMAGRALADSPAAIDAAIRPDASTQASAVRPRGTILLRGAPRDWRDSTLARAVVERGLRVSSSRCGELRAAIARMLRHARLRELPDRMLTHRFGVERLAEAFNAAAGPGCVKAVVRHG